MGFKQGTNNIITPSLGTTNINGGYLGFTNLTGGEDRPEFIYPGDIASLQVWVDPTINDISVDGGGVITNIANNEGALGSSFDRYPGGGVLESNFILGTGDTKYYRFRASDSGFLATMYLNDITSIIPKTVISIAKRFSSGFEIPMGFWELKRTADSDTENGVYHPQGRSSNIVRGGLTNRIVSPDVSLGEYVIGESDFTFFAWASADYYQFPAVGTMATNPTNTTNTTLDAAPTNPRNYEKFVINVGEDLDPGIDSSGDNHYASVMMFDEVLSADTIKKIYNYYKFERGYSIK